MRGKITSDISDIEEIKKEIKNYNPKNLVGQVSTKRPYVEGEGEIKIALLNFGCKENIVRELKKRNCTVYVYPHDTGADSLLEHNPDGIVLSNGPRRSRGLRNSHPNSKRALPKRHSNTRNMPRTSINGTCNRSKNSKTKIWT